MPSLSTCPNCLKTVFRDRLRFPTLLRPDGTWAWLEGWRTQRRAAAEARREAEAAVLRADRVRRQAIIEAEYALHGRSRLSEQLVADAMADGVPA